MRDCGFEFHQAHNFEPKKIIKTNASFHTFRDIYNKKIMRSINWEEVQKYYNDNHTWREVGEVFGISMSGLYKAKRKGKFSSRNQSEATTLSLKLKPRKLSEETKKKISLIRIKYLKEHPDKVPYLLNHYSKGETYPEKYFNCVFTGNSLTFERYLQYGVYNLDFAFVDKLINVEIDGDQHILDKSVIESNKRKDKFLQDNKWTVIRILWSEYQKLTSESKKEYINALVSSIKNFNIKNENIQIITLPSGLKKIKKHKIQIITLPSGLRKIKKSYHCQCGNEMHRGSRECIKCRNLKRYKIEWPSYEQLLNDVEQLGYVGTGKKYGVSDNAIRKRIKKQRICSSVGRVVGPYPTGCEFDPH